MGRRRRDKVQGKVVRARGKASNHPEEVRGVISKVLRSVRRDLVVVRARGVISRVMQVRGKARKKKVRNPKAKEVRMHPVEKARSNPVKKAQGNPANKANEANEVKSSQVREA